MTGNPLRCSFNSTITEASFLPPPPNTPGYTPFTSVVQAMAGLAAYLASIFVFLGAAFLLLIVTVRIPAGPPAPVASENGDVNGDGILDVSDAIYTLLHLSTEGGTL